MKVASPPDCRSPSLIQRRHRRLCDKRQPHASDSGGSRPWQPQFVLGPKTNGYGRRPSHEPGRPAPATRETIHEDVTPATLAGLAVAAPLRARAENQWLRETALGTNRGVPPWPPAGPLTRTSHSATLAGPGRGSPTSCSGRKTMITGDGPRHEPGRPAPATRATTHGEAQRRNSVGSKCRKRRRVAVSLNHSRILPVFTSATTPRNDPGGPQGSCTVVCISA